MVLPTTIHGLRPCLGCIYHALAIGFGKLKKNQVLFVIIIFGEFSGVATCHLSYRDFPPERQTWHVMVFFGDMS